MTKQISNEMIDTPWVSLRSKHENVHQLLSHQIVAPYLGQTRSISTTGSTRTGSTTVRKQFEFRSTDVLACTPTAASTSDNNEGSCMSPQMRATTLTSISNSKQRTKQVNKSSQSHKNDYLINDEQPPFLSADNNDTHHIWSSDSSSSNFNARSPNPVADGMRESLSPLSVIETISNNSKSKLTKGSNVSANPNSPFRLNKSRERVQSFLRKTLYHNNAIGEPSRPIDSRHPSSQEQKKRQQDERQSSIQSSPFPHTELRQHTQRIATPACKSEQFLPHSLGEKTSNSNSTLRKSLFSNEYTSVADEDLHENASIGSAASTASYPSVGSAGCIGIERPSYESNFDSFLHNLAPPLTTVYPGQNSSIKSNPDQSPSSIYSQSEEKITPKKKVDHSLTLSTTSSLEAVSEGAEDEEASCDEARSLTADTARFSHFEEEILFEESSDEVSCSLEDEILSPLLHPYSSRESSLFDHPFLTPDCEDEEREEAAISSEAISVGELNTADNLGIALNNVEPSPGTPSACTGKMKSLSRFLAKNSPPELAYTPDEASRCSATLSSKRSVGYSLRSLGDEVKKKSKVLKNKVSRASSVAGEPQSKAALNSVAPNEASVKIYLLLLDPKTKVFELIQLLFPSLTTTVRDILRMIPPNATEKRLGSQAYVGLTRPKRSAEPITNLDVLASSPTGKRSTDLSRYAGICEGDVIIAIPDGCEQKALINLGKQILANPHIQQLVGSTSKDAKMRKAKRAQTRNLKEDVPMDNINDSQTNRVNNRARNKRNMLNKFSIQSPQEIDRQHPMSKVDGNLPSTLDVINSNICIPRTAEKENSGMDRYEEELQRAIQKAIHSNPQSDFSPASTSLMSSETTSNEEYSRSIASVNTLFPQVDALDAFILAREERSSSITSRETRTTVEELDYSTKESYTTDTADDTSLTGSFESSFYSWSRSLDSSMASRYNGSSRSATSKARTIITFDEVSFEQRDSTPPRLVRKRLGKTLVRIILGTSFFMFLRYCLDYEFGYTSIAAVERRAEIPTEPLGLTGFIYFALVFALLVKLQRYLVKSQQKHLRRNGYSLCPVMQAGYDLCEQFKG